VPPTARSSGPSRRAASPGGYYGWASPLGVDGYAYVGLSTNGGNPLVDAGLLQIALKTHVIVRFFNTTANGTIGASIWTSPSSNGASKTVFVTTGDAGPNGSVYADSIRSFNAPTPRLLGSWTIPVSQPISDGDFGATPVVFSTANGTKLVAASDKNGILCAWNPSHLARGPLWQERIACPSTSTGTGTSNLGPVPWDAGRLCVGSSATQVKGVNFPGSVRPLVPATGAPVWERGESTGPVYGAPPEANGIVAVGAGSTFQVLDASSRTVLLHYVLPTGAFDGPAATAHGEIVIGATDGTIYSFGLSTCLP
jgi:hypothetical protein